MNKRLKRILADTFRIRESQIDLALSRADIDNWDSLTQMDLVTSLEREYDIVLGIEEIARMESVAQIVEVLKEKGIESAIEGSVALVTGGAAGLGYAIATDMVRRGAKVIVADRDPGALESLSDGLHGYVIDVTQPAEVKRVVESIMADHGRVDILINNAGVIHSEPLVNVMDPSHLMHDYGRFCESLNSNMNSVFIVTAAVVENMVKNRTKGSIINISSISARGNAGQLAYSAAKSAVNAMTVVCAKELGRWGIRCNSVAPGFIDTESTRRALSESTLRDIQARTPLRRLGQAHEVAHAVAALIENDFISGHILEVNGGLTI